MNTYLAHSRSNPSIDHFVRLGAGARKPYSGMSARALCGARVFVEPSRTAGTAPGFKQPVGTCKRCAATLGQTVRTIGA